MGLGGFGGEGKVAEPEEPADAPDSCDAGEGKHGSAGVLGEGEVGGEFDKRDALHHDAQAGQDCGAAEGEGFLFGGEPEHQGEDYAVESESDVVPTDVSGGDDIGCNEGGGADDGGGHGGSDSGYESGDEAGVSEGEEKGDEEYPSEETEGSRGEGEGKHHTCDEGGGGDPQ